MKQLSEALVVIVLLVVSVPVIGQQSAQPKLGSATTSAKPAPQPKSQSPQRTTSATTSPQPQRPAIVAQPTVPAPSPISDMPRSAFIQAMDAEFRQRDTNGDGKVTRAEIELFERSIAFASAQTANRAMFARLDVDRNGILTPGEFAALVSSPSIPDVSQLMSRIDLNRDQVISLVEYRTAKLTTFDRLDADKNGVVTDAEYRAVQNKTPYGR